MGWQYNPDMLAILIPAVITLALAYVAWQRRPVPGSKYLAGIMLAVTWWLLTYTVELGNASLAAKVFWVQMQHMGIVPLPTLWLAFILAYTGKTRWLTRRNLILLAIEPALTMALVWTNELHHLVWVSVGLDTSGSYAVLQTSYGFWSWLHLVYAVLLGISGVALLVRSLLRHQAYSNGQTIAAITAAVIAIIGFLPDLLFHNLSIPIQLAPLGLTLAGLIFTLSIVRFRLWDIVPLARDTVIENMSDGLIVLDIQNHIVDLNIAAKTILDRSTKQIMGQFMEKVWSAWPAEMTLPLGKVEIVKEVTLSTPQGQRVFDLRISSLSDQRNQLSGRLVVLRDITRQKRAEETLRRRDDILEAIGFAAERFLKRISWEQSIQEVLAHLGEATRVSRAYLLENQNNKDDKPYTSYRFEWVGWGVHSLISEPQLQSISWTDLGLSRWVEELSQGNVLNDLVKNLPDAEQTFLKPHETLSIAVVPIFVDKTWWGALGFEDCASERAWTSIEIEALRTAANTIGAAVQRRRAEEEIRHWADVITTLLDLTEIIGSTLDIPQVLDRVVLAARSLIPADRVTVFLWDEEENALVPTLSSANAQKQFKLTPKMAEIFIGLRLRPDEIPLIKELQQKKQFIAINQSNENPLFPLNMGHTYEVCSLLVVPIVFQERFTGILYIDYIKETHTFSSQEINLATTLTRQAGLAIERARLYTQSQKDADELAALYRASTQLLNPGRDLHSLAQHITQVVTQEFSFSYCSLLIVDREVNCLRMIAQNGTQELADVPLPLEGMGLTTYAARTGEAVYTPDVSKDERYLMASSSTRSEAVFPLRAGEEVIAVLNIESTELNAFDARARRILAAFVDDSALALQNVRLFIAAETHAHQVAMLNDITRTALEKSDLPESLQALANRMTDLIDSDDCYIALWDEEHQHVHSGAASKGLKESGNMAMPEPGSSILTEAVLRLSQPIAIDDLANSSHLSHNIAEKFPSHSVLVLPLIAGEQKLGAVIMGFKQPHHFTSQEIAICEQAAGQIALTVAEAWSLDTARKLAQEANNLRQAGAIVTSTLNEDEAIQLILQQLVRVAPCDSASVQLLREGYLEIVGGLGWDDVDDVIGVHFPVPGDNPNTIVVQERQPYILGDAPSVYASFRQLPHSHIHSWLGVPLIVHDQVIGILAMDSKQPNYFTRDHARVSTAFADQVAIVIENARLYAAEQNRVQQLDALRATAADISAELEISRLLQTILGRAVSLLHATGGELGLYNESTNQLDIVASNNMGKDFTGTHMAMGEGAMGKAAENLTPLIIHDYQQWDGRSPQYVQGVWHTVMVSPLLVHGRLVGAIGIMDADPERYFNRSDLQLLTLFAQQSAIAVENARLYQEARRAAERRTILHRISQEIVTASVYSETSRDQIYTAVHKAASQLMPVEAFAITLLDEEKHEVEAVYLIDKGGRSPTMRIPQGEGLTGRVLALGMSLYIEDVQANSNTAGVHFGSPESVRSILAVPLRFGDRLIGMISAQSYQPNAYTTEDQYLLEMLAANTAIAIQNADLLKKIHWLGITDPLTDLYNRRGFFDLAGREVERFRRFGHPFCALMVDIDNFKQVNDTHGHAIGDQVLIALAKGLELQIRDVDFIGRYGGEEFVIVLPETELPAAIQAAERLREYVENQPITTDRGVLSITVSIGVAKFEENIPELAILIDRADSAMYLAKQSGRNQVKVYQDK